jgi:hypothetical protein
MDASLYATYKRGYRSHIPKIQKEIIQRIQNNKHIPGYQGFVNSIKSVNKFQGLMHP